MDIRRLTSDMVKLVMVCYILHHPQQLFLNILTSFDKPFDSDCAW